MIESEWLKSDDAEAMLERVHQARSRKLRLFAVTCCRRVWHLLTDQQSRKAIEVEELFLDGLVGREVRRKAYAAVWNFGSDESADESDDIAHATALTAVILLLSPNSRASNTARLVSTYCAAAVGHYARDSMPGANHEEIYAIGRISEIASQAPMLRDIFGNPFRPVAIEPQWLTWNHATVPAIARHVYDDRAFHDLPILADALEDAGCANADLLGHCRGPSPHVRGCWAVDLLLGKS